MNSKDPVPTWQVKSVVKAIHILSCFTPSDPELSLGDISHKLNVPKSTALNLIRTLEEYGYLIRTYPSMNYRLGYSIMQLNYCTQMSMPVVRYSLPFLEDLQMKTGKTIYLTTHINGKVLYLDVAHQNRRMFSYSISGKTLNMHCTGCGKAMLAYLPENEIRKIIDTYGFPTFTPNTISTEEALYQELNLIRKRGYSTDHEEETLGVRCIAAPIRNAQGYPTAAISISGAVLSMQEEQVFEYADVLINTCHALSSYANEFPAGQILLLNQKQGNAAD
ncbi:MAG: IclR family transcriptional regulator [Lachnospiraceae bacterium]|nr:IclR family transcriptional regulator [Lachnospiraceae bacterium]